METFFINFTVIFGKKYVHTFLSRRERTFRLSFFFFESSTTFGHIGDKMRYLVNQRLVHGTGYVKQTI